MTSPKKSDLGVRAASAVVMIAVAGTALWLGGWVWTAFVVFVGSAAWIEWVGLWSKIIASPAGILVAALVGGGYIGGGVFMLIELGRLKTDGGLAALVPIALVIATDIGAYFTGRSIGGPKIAPKISPSKTWAGLAGGMVAAALVMAVFASTGPAANQPIGDKIFTALMAMPVAVVAQAGDFFESWLKRRAGVKDSGRLIPGHGGVLDRIDGLLSVLFVGGIVWLLNVL